MSQFKTVKKIVPAMFRGTFLGFLSGVLPGAGASIGRLLHISLKKSF